MNDNSSSKKDEFLKEVTRVGCAVLVGPLLTENEIENLPDAPLILVDGGTREALKLGLDRERRCFKVGDGDSGGIELDEALPPEKDYSDLSYALNLLPKEVKKIFLIGFLGGRKDHELINFGEVHQFLVNKPSPCVAKFSSEIHLLSEGEWQLSHDGIVSLMVLEKASVSLVGKIKYPLESPTELFPLSSRGLSNEASGDFSINSNGPVMIYGDGLKISFE
jgi:thiamine pyrophosphokinase